MTKRSIALGIAALGFFLLSAPQVEAQADAVRVLVSNGMKAAMEELRPQCERAIGHPLALQFDSTAGLKKKIESGEAFDVALVTSQAIDDLIKQGKLAGSRAALGRVQLGIGIRAGAARPDIHTPEALKQTLRAAKTITYREDGASRSDIDKMFGRLGITAEMKSKVILTQGSGTSTDNVAAGKAQYVITLSSEIMTVRGLQLLDPLPREFRYDIPFEGAVSANARDAQAARALLAFLAGPKVALAFKATGINRP